MKNIFLLLLFLAPVISHAQKIPDMGLNKVRLTEPDKTVVAELDETDAHPKAKPALYYAWYSAGTIHSTQGGYSGTLLNGLYTEYYPDKNLKEQGIYKKGLKDGVWKSWKENGTLNPTVTWKKGAIATKTPHTHKKIWQKLHFFKKKPKSVPAAKPGTP